MSRPTLTEVSVIARGVRRPEGVAACRDGRVYAADGNSTVAEILADGTFRGLGRPALEPNGLNLTVDGSALVVAEFGSHELLRCEVSTGEVTLLCDTVQGRRLSRPNYPVVMSDGTIYCTSSTASDVIDCIVHAYDDGFVCRIRPDGTADIVADGLQLPNGLAVDAAEEFLYVVRTSVGDVVRFPILGDGTLGAQEPYGPPLGDRTEWGADAVRFAWGDNPIRDFTTWNPELQPRWALPDGCAFDVDGNLWVTLAGRNAIVAILPDGEVCTIVGAADELVVRPSTVAFGGSDLRDVYIGSAEASFVVRGRSSVAGLALAGQGPA
ncbi:SMP-30/gluconolactonase/LRE family protein [uncultured Jatrophihabitans sp.]|uniref:SMP-30/gluconolactonase/LRE family protein n=1 Tax=uncultured Jatrophihabitans sp. TaxID=1610747 RepID=UPI0035CC730A